MQKSVYVNVDGQPGGEETRRKTDWCAVCVFYVNIVLLCVAVVVLFVEIVSSVQAKQHLFELSLAAQVNGDICLPLDFRSSSSTWTPSGSVDGGFHKVLDGKSTGLEDIFGIYSPSSLALLFSASTRNLSVSAADTFENFEKLQSMPEFDLEKRYSNGIWGQYYNVMNNCNEIFSTGYILLTSLLNATSSIMNREQETKENSIPSYIWSEKVTLPPTYKCPDIYNNDPRTLLNYANASNECLRDRFKHAYVEGVYKAPHTADAIATQINDIVLSLLTSSPSSDPQPSYEFKDPREGCPPELAGVMCPLFLAYMRATVITHAGQAQVGDQQLELANAMLTWIYEGFHKDLFSQDADAVSKTSQAAETLFCFYAKAARDGLAADDASAIQVRWLKAVQAKNDPLLSEVFGYDAVATESVHNSLALGFQGAVASTHLIKDLWSEQQKGSIKPGELACDAEKRRKFLRESLRHSSPGVPVMFSNTKPGTHSLLSGDGDKQVRFEGGEGHVDLVTHFIPARHSINFDKKDEFDMNRAELSCPFLKRQLQYNTDMKRGGCGEDVTTLPGYSDSNVVFGSTGDVDPSTHHSFCRVDESNVVINTGSSDDDFAYWMTSNTAYSPFGYGYRRCPGESLMWRTLDDFVKRVDEGYDVHLTHPLRDLKMERWGLATVPSNGLGVRLTQAQASGGPDRMTCS